MATLITANPEALSEFTIFHLNCCLEWIDKDIDGVNHRVRCMNVFTVDSNRCITHTMTSCKDGSNMMHKYMKRNQTANWGMIKDTSKRQEPVKLKKWQ